VYPLIKTEVTLGRDINNEIVINDAEISRKHCLLKLVGNGYIIEDLGSTNGTWVDEQRISRQYQLNHADTIRLGDNISLTYEVIGYDADATVATPSAAPPTAQIPPAQQFQTPQQQYQQAPPPSKSQQYGGRVPAPAEPPKIFGMNRTLAIGLGALAVIGICLIAFLVYVDANCLWCEITWDLLPGCPYTGTCP
jgi:pSer/pThr/pTyr-binding forkhead associated (FHA) protein